MAAVVPASIEASRLVGAQALRLQFAAPLLQGRLLSRPNRFVMEVRVDGEASVAWGCLYYIHRLPDQQH